MCAMQMYVHMYVYTCVYTCVRMCGGQRLMPDIIPDYSPLNLLRWGPADFRLVSQMALGESLCLP